MKVEDSTSCQNNNKAEGAQSKRIKAERLKWKFQSGMTKWIGLEAEGPPKQKDR